MRTVWLEGERLTISRLNMIQRKVLGMGQDSSVRSRLGR